MGSETAKVAQGCGKHFASRADWFPGEEHGSHIWLGRSMWQERLARKHLLGRSKQKRQIPMCYFYNLNASQHKKTQLGSNHGKCISE